ncbi:MAG TPA: TraR/DksA C4-type zinc finger protein [Anaerolineae bacterium]
MARSGSAAPRPGLAGRRTLRVEDYGKVAATFIDTKTEEAIRIFPSRDSRQLALAYAPEARHRWQGYLLGYQRIPADRLFTVEAVQLNAPTAQIISRAGVRVNCDVCGEEIINEREVRQGSLVLCRPCAGESYYMKIPDKLLTIMRLTWANGNGHQRQEQQHSDDVKQAAPASPG